MADREHGSDEVEPVSQLVGALRRRQLERSEDQSETPPGTPRRSVLAGPSRNREHSNGSAHRVQASPGRPRSANPLDGESPLKTRASVQDMGTLRLDSIQENDQSFTAPQRLFSAFAPETPRRYAKSKRDEASDEPIADKDSDAGEDGDAAYNRPPSFAESQFATIIRRQRKRRVVSPTSNIQALGMSSALDLEAHHVYPPTIADPFPATSEWADVKGGHSDPTSLPTDRRDPLMAIHRVWEFAGWGSISLLELPPQRTLDESKVVKPPQLGQWKATAIAGNAVTGSVFYALPAVVAVSSVLSPISVLIACLLLYPFRPVICELASALSASNAGNYSYMSNVSTKTVAVLAAAITLLDAVATGAVSAGTASAYIAAEVAHIHSGIDYRGISLLLLVGLAVFCLAGLRESSSMALAMFALHILTMAMLIVAGILAWVRLGNGVLKDNWTQGISSLSASNSGKGIARAIFDGICVAFVGLTGIECTPSYVNQVRAGQFPKALRNLHLIIVLTEAPLMLLVLAVVPLNQALSGANILALLGQVAGRGAWLKLFVVIDACLVLCGGIITGVVAFCGLVDSLCQDRVVPRFLHHVIPGTGAPYPAVFLFLALTIIMSATCSFNLTTLSSVFSVSFLCVMTLFGISLMLVRFSRPSLPRAPVSPLILVFSSLAVGITAMAGNFALSPVIIVQTLVYFIALAAALLILARRVDLARCLVWLLEHRRQSASGSLTSNAEKSIIRWIRAERKAPVIYFTNTDDISVLVNALNYIQRNEPTSNCKLVHCYKSIDEIPEQLDETFQLVDEIFPTITVDLVFVEAAFTPQVVHAITTKLQISKSRAFIACPSGRGSHIGSAFDLAAYGGVRIILP